jgi:transposase-like protein
MADKNTRSKRYTEEFRLQAAKLIVEGGVIFCSNCWLATRISSDTIIVGLLSRNRKLLSDNDLQFYEKESNSVQITQILRKLKPAPHVLTGI